VALCQIKNKNSPFLCLLAAVALCQIKNKNAPLHAPYLPLDRVTAPGTPTALGPSSPELAVGHRPAAGASRRLGRGGHRVDGIGRGGGAARQRRNTGGAWIHLTGWSPLTYGAVAPGSTGDGDGIFLGRRRLGVGTLTAPSPSFRSGPTAMGCRRRPLAGCRGWLLAS
jgi:hypothetical protein